MVCQHKDMPASGPLKANRLTITQLDSENPDALFSKGTITDIVGDTIVILDGMPFATRLVMYNVNTGEYLGQINHIGHGPGEYRIITAAFIDGQNQSVIIPDYDKPIANVFSLKNDSLIAVLDRPDISSLLDPIGNITDGINISMYRNDTLSIIKCNGSYAAIDTLMIPDFKGNNFSKCWLGSGGKGYIINADTLYRIDPSIITPIAVINCGEYTLTANKIQEVMDKIFNTDISEPEILSPFILIRDIVVSDDMLLLTTMHANEKNSDLYDLKTGQLLYRNKYSDLSILNHIAIATDENDEIEVENLYEKDGMWYGIARDSNKSAEAISYDSNYRIVTFSL